MTRRLASFLPISLNQCRPERQEHDVKTTEAKVSKGEIEVFKAIHDQPDEVRGTDGELRKVDGKKKRKVKANAAKDHPGVRAALRASHGQDAVDWLDGTGVETLNLHGATSGSSAFGPGSNDPKTPPSNSAINAREVRRKQRLIAEQSKKGYAVGSDAGVDVLRKIHQGGPSGRLA